MSKTIAIAKNSLYLYLRMLVVLGTSLYTVRVVLKALGVEDLGIYGLAGGMVAIFAFLNATMTRAAQRFLGIEIGKGDAPSLNRTFNSILIANGAIALFVVVMSLSLGSWLLNHKLKIPTDRLSAANIVLYFSTATTVAMVLRTPYSALIISRQKLWFFSITSILEASLKLGIAFSIAHALHDRLTLYAALTCALSWLLLGCYIAFCRVKFRESKIALHGEISLYRDLLAFTGWSFIGNLSHVFRTQGVNMLLNIFYGTSLNAVYSVMSQAQGAASQFTGSFELALSSEIYKSYGQGNVGEVQSLVFTGCKLNFILLAALVGPAIYGMDYILHFWLGRTLEYLATFIAWMLLAQLIETLSQPLMVAAFATGHVKRYQLAVGGTILLNLPLSWLAFKLGGGPPSFLYVALAIQFATFALRVWFLKRVIQLHIPTFLRSVVLPLVAITCIGGALLYIVQKTLPPPHQFRELLLGSLSIAAPLVIACFFICFTRAERRFFLDRVFRKLGKLVIKDR